MPLGAHRPPRLPKVETQAAVRSHRGVALETLPAREVFLAQEALPAQVALHQQPVVDHSTLVARRLGVPMGHRRPVADRQRLVAAMVIREVSRLAAAILVSVAGRLLEARMQRPVAVGPVPAVQLPVVGQGLAECLSPTDHPRAVGLLQEALPAPWAEPVEPMDHRRAAELLPEAIPHLAAWRRPMASHPLAARCPSVAMGRQSVPMVFRLPAAQRRTEPLTY